MVAEYRDLYSLTSFAARRLLRALNSYPNAPYTSTTKEEKHLICSKQALMYFFFFSFSCFAMIFEGDALR